MKTLIEKGQAYCGKCGCPYKNDKHGQITKEEMKKHRCSFFRQIFHPDYSFVILLFVALAITYQWSFNAAWYWNIMWATIILTIAGWLNKGSENISRYKRKK